MKHDVNSLDNKKIKELTLDKNIFGVELKDEIIYRMVRYQLAKRRSGNHKTKGISEISEQQKNLLSKKEQVAQGKEVRDLLKCVVEQ